jgi:hypothetical protein
MQSPEFSGLGMCAKPSPPSGSRFRFPETRPLFSSFLAFFLLLSVSIRLAQICLLRAEIEAACAGAIPHRLHPPQPAPPGMCLDCQFAAIPEFPLDAAAIRPANLSLVTCCPLPSCCPAIARKRSLIPSYPSSASSSLSKGGAPASCAGSQLPLPLLQLAPDLKQFSDRRHVKFSLFSLRPVRLPSSALGCISAG